MIPTEDGIHSMVPEEVYHADRGSLSVSGAKLLLPPSCPAKFRWAMDNGRKPKKVWDFGHVAHHLVLGKGAEFTVLDPAVHGLTKDGKPAASPAATAMWKAAEQDARDRGRTPISLVDFEKAEAMAAEVLRHPVAGPIFADGTAEVSLYHAAPETGVRLRCRCDWIEPGGDIDDYKTSITANPTELVRKFWALGYFMQAAWYIDLAVAVGAAENPRFRFVVQEKEPPFLVTVVEYDQESIDEGRRLNRLAIRTYAECVSSGVWPGYSDSIVRLSLPSWVLHQSRAEADLADAATIIAELEGIYQ